MSVGWRAEIGAEWNVLGPFPIQAREQHYLSPSFPLVNLSKPIDLNKSWPSAYADDGRVFWSRATSGVDGTLNVTFPDIRWKYLRATEGWASLQHHSLLHTTLTIYPPSGDEALPGFRFHLVQGSYFTILPTDDTRESYVPEWYMGNIYDFQDALPRIVSLPSPPSLDIPTRYDIFVSGDYEIRLFGDPNVRGSDTPELVIRMTVDIEQVDDPIVHEPSQDVLCDFVDGIPFGNVLGIALRSRKGGWTVSSVSGLAETSLALISGQKYTIAPGQTRIVPLLANNRRLGEQMIGPELMLAVNLVSDTSQRRVMLIKLPINHVTHWEQNLHKPIIGTYMYESSMPTAFVAVPPASKSELGSAPPILALHGAGVEALKDPFWVEALPRRDTNWYIVPQGRTSWGLDWHGPSAKDAWTAVDALHDILIGVDEWQEWQIQEKSKVIIMGHSNGGQGAWYIAARYPDRVVAVIPAAAYVKSQAYISLHMSRAGHFIDPALRAILETSLTPDDNDLHLSNLKDIPVLAIHGGSDENVPVWHSRQLVDILDSQNNHSVARFREVEGQPHFWPEVFQNDEVENFLDKFSSKSNSRSGDGPEEFTLTVASPQESGSLQGFRVESLAIPGRLGRLRVKVDGNGGVNVETVNIRSFSVQRKPSFWASMNVDRFSLPAHFFADTSRVYLTKPSSSKSDTWKLSTVSDQTPHRYQAPSRLQGILLSGGPVGIVYANDLERGSSAAVRIAHDLFLYHKLDSYVMSETDAEERLKHSSLKEGNLVYIGKPSSALARSILSEGRTAFSSGGSHLSIGGRDLSDPTIGAVFLHPHPDMTQPQNSMMFMLAYNNVGLERALRLFPIRTGVPAPSWVVSSERADAQGAGGIIGAGVWTGDWQWQEALSLQQY